MSRDGRSDSLQQKVFFLVAVFAHRRKECYLINVCMTGIMKCHKHVLIKRTFTVSRFLSVYEPFQRLRRKLPKSCCHIYDLHFDVDLHSLILGYESLASRPSQPTNIMYENVPSEKLTSVILWVMIALSSLIGEQPIPSSEQQNSNTQQQQEECKICVLYW